MGKSTLFNRLIGVRYAVTSSVAGTTRDRIYHDAQMGDFTVLLVDTGGLVFESGLKNIEADVQSQARVAIEEADLIYFVVDAGESITASDMECAQMLRKTAKPVLFIAHKADSKGVKGNHSDLLEVGFGEPIMVSSIHALGLVELREQTIDTLKKHKFTKEKPPSKSNIRLSIVGKPNVGKSSYVNAILGEQRLIVSDIPGTTIDATDTPFVLRSPEGKELNTKFTLIDTAGLRRRGRRLGLERFGSMRSLRAIARSDITILMLDWSAGLAKQDMHVSEYILEAGKGLVIVVNKSDMMKDPEKDREKFLNLMHRRMDYIPWAPVIFTSNLDKKNIFKVLETVKKIHEERFKKVPAKEFSVFTKAIVEGHPPLKNAKKIKFYQGEQIDTNPPKFCFTCSYPELLHFSYKRYLENEIRRRYGFFGTPIYLEFPANERERKSEIQKATRKNERGYDHTRR